MPHAKHFRNAGRSQIQAALAEWLRREQGVESANVHQHPVMRAAGSVLERKGRKRKAGKKRKKKGARPEDAFVDCLEILVEYIEALIEFKFRRARDLKNEFKKAECDPGWLEAAAVWVLYYYIEGKKPRYNVLPADEGSYSLPAAREGRTRVGLIADWGTGEQVSHVVLDEVFKHEPDVILHLGDVYYAGTAGEQKANVWEVLASKRQEYGPVPFYNLPGNHDYYSGGGGFYEYIDRFNIGIRGGSVQQASYFALHNDHWQLQGMDTGYNDHVLADVGNDTTSLLPTEVEWHKSQIAKAGNRKILLLSHHQLFSSLEPIGKDKNWYNPSLVDSYQQFVSSLTDGGSIAGWLWGHEHLLEVYDPPTEQPELLRTEPPGKARPFRWPTGRCIGCGAFPVLYDGGKPYRQRSVPVALVDDPKKPGEPLELGTTRDGEAYNHGYVIMDLVGADAQLTYYEVPGDGRPFEGTDKFSRRRYREKL